MKNSEVVKKTQKLDSSLNNCFIGMTPESKEGYTYLLSKKYDLNPFLVRENVSLQLFEFFLLQSLNNLDPDYVRSREFVIISYEYLKYIEKAEVKISVVVNKKNKLFFNI